VIALPYRTKPLKGQECNGCGYCCQQEVCSIGEGILGNAAQAPCALLRYRDGRTYCGAVEQGTKLTRILFRKWLGIGKGCCSNDDLYLDV
jgi:hypothetical protein